MKETTQLVLVFTTAVGDEFSLRINNPKANLEQMGILQAMNNIVTSNVFRYKGHALETPLSAYVREIVITNYVEE